MTEIVENAEGDEYQRIFDQFGRKGPRVPSRFPVPPPLPRFGFIDRLDSEQFQFFNSLSQEFGGLSKINIICEHRPLIRKVLGATAKLCGYYLTDYEPHLVLKIVSQTLPALSTPALGYAPPFPIKPVDLYSQFKEDLDSYARNYKVQRQVLGLPF